MVFALQPSITGDAAKGLRYGEDLFCSIYTYINQSTDIRELLEKFFNHLLTKEKNPYMFWLQKKHLYDNIRSMLSMPGFFDRMIEISKHDIYKQLVFHMPASDFLDRLEVDMNTRILCYNLTDDDIRGSTIYFIAGKEKIALLHTIFL